MDRDTYEAKFALYQKLVGAGAFPKTFKGTVNHIIALSQNPNAGAKDLAQIVAADPAISTKVITVVNSPYYGLHSQVCCLTQAITLLGFEETKQICLSVSVFEGFKRSDVEELMRIWRHSISVGVFSRIIGEHIGKLETEAYTAGLLHDIGKILLYSINPRAARAVQNNYLYEKGKVSFPDMETKLLGIDHAWVGYCAATQWNLPVLMREAIFAHHRPDTELSPGSRALAYMIYTANQIADSLGFPSTPSSGALGPQDCLSVFTDQVSGALQIDREGFNRIVEKVKSSGMAEVRAFMSIVEPSGSTRWRN